MTCDLHPAFSDHLDDSLTDMDVTDPTTEVIDDDAGSLDNASRNQEVGTDLDHSVQQQQESGKYSK